MKEKVELIPHSHRGELIILDRCRVERDGNTVIYKQAQSGYVKSFNIPYINTNIILLGNGTSITNEAMFLLSQQGVLVAFTGGKGLPLFSAMEPISIFYPQNEYRPTEYNQAFSKIVMNEENRLSVAKEFFYKRIENTRKYWKKLEIESFIKCDITKYFDILDDYKIQIENIDTNEKLLLTEGRFTKKIYSIFAKEYNVNFVRDLDKTDNVNEALTQLNYICYGISAVCLYSLGISHSFAVFHGKTRRGGLVFDVADLIKDSFSIPFAFYSEVNDIKETELKNLFIDEVYKENIFREIILFLKNMCQLNHT